MTQPTTNELKQHSNDLADFGKKLRNLNGSSKALVNAAVAVFALIVVIPFLTPVFA